MPGACCIKNYVVEKWLCSKPKCFSFSVIFRKKKPRLCIASLYTTGIVARVDWIDFLCNLGCRTTFRSVHFVMVVKIDVKRHFLNAKIVTNSHK
jgi:hypothetical protein